MDTKQKILVCGDVNGNFKAFFNKIESINQKSGPFEFALCVGDFFGDDNRKLEAYKNGNLKISVPTYILGPNCSEHASQYENVNDGEICTNLTYLGRRGLYTTSSGIKVAYVSGIEAKSGESNEEWHFTAEDVKSVANTCVASNSSSGEYRGIDILITSQWPEGTREKEPNTSKLLSWLSSEIKPRYHFCGLNKCYFEPSPYRNTARSNSQFELATRFIALASVGNPEKSKFMYALSILPVEKMRLTELIQKTTNEIACPYDSMRFEVSGKQVSTGDNSQFFYDMNSYGADDNRRRGKRGNAGYGDNKMKRPRQPNFDQEKCWFCLSSPSVEKHLVISVGDNFYLALAKGPINKYHILILSVTHIQSASLLSEEDWTELEKFKTALRKFFHSKNQTVVFFERNYRSGHLQINVVGVDKSIEWKIKHTFDDKAEEYNLSFETIPALTEATQLPERGPYFVAELPDESTLLCRQMKMFPLHFGREVFCSEELLNCEDKSDWRQCSLSKETEIDYVKEFRNEFKQFDFTM